MSTTTRNKSVDFDRLNYELRTRGLNMRQASIKMGRSDTYLGNMKPKGHLPTSTLVMMDTLWNVKYDDVKPIKAKEPEAKISPSEIRGEFVTMSNEDLRHIITEAVKDAFVWYANR